LEYGISGSVASSKKLWKPRTSRALVAMAFIPNVLEEKPFFEVAQRLKLTKSG
jgi:hypothetical protein